MITHFHERQGRYPQSEDADTTYGNGELLQWFDDRGITTYIRVKQCPTPTRDLCALEKFTYVPEENCFICPEGKPLKYVGVNQLNRTHTYHSDVETLSRMCAEGAVHARKVSHHLDSHLRGGEAESL
jgi:hypothetical protein